MTTREDEIKKVSEEVNAIMETMIQRHGYAGAALMVAMLIEDDRIMEGVADDDRARWRIIAAKLREKADEFTVKTKQ
jgi:hypothetical protein